MSVKEKRRQTIMQMKEERVKSGVLGPSSVLDGLKVVKAKHTIYDTAIWKTLPYLSYVKPCIKWMPRY